MWAPDAALAREVRQKRNGLNRLPETHLVRQDTVECLVVTAHQPIETDVLILAKRVLQQKRNPTLHIRRIQRVPLRLERARVARERIEDATSLVRRPLLLGGHLGRVVNKRVDAKLVLVVGNLRAPALIPVPILFLLVSVLLLVSAAVRRFHLAVPAHELFDGNLRVRGEIVDLRGGVAFVLLLGAAHLLLKRRLVVRVILGFAEVLPPVILGGFPLALHRCVLDDVRERILAHHRLVSLGFAFGFVLHLNHGGVLRLDVPAPGRLRVRRLFHLAVLLEQFLDGNLRVRGEIVDLRGGVAFVLLLGAAHLLFQRRLVVLSGHLVVVGSILVGIRVLLVSLGHGRERLHGRGSRGGSSATLSALSTREFRREHGGVPLRLPEQEIEVLVHHRLSLGVDGRLRLEPHNLLDLDPEVHHLVGDVPRRLSLRRRLVLRAFDDARLEVEVRSRHRVRRLPREFMPKLSLPHEIPGEPFHLLQEMIPVCLVPRGLGKVRLRFRARRAV